MLLRCDYAETHLFLFYYLMITFFFILAESPYMEMAIELCTSGSLKQYLNEAQLWTLNQHSAVFFLLRGIVHGMEYLHDLGYLHKVITKFIYRGTLVLF